MPNDRFLLTIGFFFLATLSIVRADPPMVVHVFVALCDNKHQGIVPVSAKIGNGDNPPANLYWGCSDGLKSYFHSSKRWKLIKSVQQQPGEGIVLERCLFEHASGKIVLVADAYRGREIKQCTEDFFAAVAGASDESSFEGHEIAGRADFVAYIGHTGLMEFEVATPEPTADRTAGGPVPVAALACLSDRFFSERLRVAGGEPVLMTRQLMYPGSFLLHDALEGWLAGEDKAQLRARAGKAYAKNQGISVKAATGVFAELD